MDQSLGHRVSQLVYLKFQFFLFSFQLAGDKGKERERRMRVTNKTSRLLEGQLPGKMQIMQPLSQLDLLAEDQVFEIECFHKHSYTLEQ